MMKSFVAYIVFGYLLEDISNESNIFHY